MHHPDGTNVSHAVEVVPSGVTPKVHCMKSDPWSCTRSSLGVGSIKVEKLVSYFSPSFKIMRHASLFLIKPLVLGFHCASQNFQGNLNFKQYSGSVLETMVSIMERAKLKRTVTGAQAW